MSPPVTPKTPPSFLAMPELQARRMLNAALGQLSPLQRQLVITHLRTGDDAERLAARLGLARDSARASLSFAVAQLRMALSDAPLDKTREDWLQRCRALLEAARTVQKTPTHEVDLPASWGSVERVPTPPTPTPTEADAAPETHYLVVETRNSVPVAVVAPAVDTPAPVASVRLEPERLEPERVATPRVAPAARPAKATIPPPTRPRRVEAAPRIWPWAVAGLAVLALAIGAWQFASSPKEVAPPKPMQPQRVPALSEPAAPLTASDFQLVLLRQQHEGVLEDLDFYLWLSEQEDAR